MGVDLEHAVELVRATMASAGANAVTCLMQPRRACAALAVSVCGDTMQQRRSLNQPLTRLLPQSWQTAEGLHAEWAIRGGAIAELSSSLNIAGWCSWLTLNHDGPFAAFAIEHGSAQPPLSTARRAQIESLGPLLKSAMRTALDLIDTGCELTITRTLGSIYDVTLLFDAQSRRLVWSSSYGGVLHSLSDHQAAERVLGEQQSALLAANRNDEPVTAFPKLALGAVRAFRPLSEPTPFGSDCAAVGLASCEAADDVLSARERQVAELLARGYEPANIAAIAGIAEHTVRTYIRRTYKKLGVRTRAELVRRLLLPGVGGRSSNPRSARR